MDRPRFCMALPSPDQWPDAFGERTTSLRLFSVFQALPDLSWTVIQVARLVFS